MLQKSQISVQPLLDEVMSSGKESKVKGPVRLEDIEADVAKDPESSLKKEIPDLEQNKENISKNSETPNTKQEMVAFNMLVEKMKSSGTLPEKPQPAVSFFFTLLILKKKLAMVWLIKSLLPHGNVEKCIIIAGIDLRHKTLFLTAYYLTNNGRKDSKL